MHQRVVIGRQPALLVMREDGLSVEIEICLDGYHAVVAHCRKAGDGDSLHVGIDQYGNAFHLMLGAKTLSVVLRGPYGERDEDMSVVAMTVCHEKGGKVTIRVRKTEYEKVLAHFAANQVGGFSDSVYFGEDVFGFPYRLMLGSDIFFIGASPGVSESTFR